MRCGLSDGSRSGACHQSSCDAGHSRRSGSGKCGRTTGAVGGSYQFTIRNHLLSPHSFLVGRWQANVRVLGWLGPQCRKRRLPSQRKRPSVTHKREEELYDHFTAATFRALTRFAEHGHRSLAKAVRYNMRRQPPSFIYGEDFRPRHLWDEYCFEVLEGPTPQLEWSWEHAIQPHFTHRIEQLPSEIAVLLTIAAQWDGDDLEIQDGTVRSDELISRGIWGALQELADDDATRRSGTREGGAYP